MNCLVSILSEFTQKMSGEVHMSIPNLMGMMPVIIAGLICRTNNQRFKTDHVHYGDYIEAFLMMSLPHHFAGKDTAFTAQMINVFKTLLVLHFDHGGNASTNVEIGTLSTGASLSSAFCSAISALSGHKHGGACQDVITMLKSLYSQNSTQETIAKEVSDLLDEVESKKRKLAGFGHPEYLQEDPRAVIIRRIIDNLPAQLVSKNTLLQYADELRKQASKRPFLVKQGGRIIAPNVDFYSGIVYQILGFEHENIYPLLFVLGRQVGWCANALVNQGMPIVRPRELPVVSMSGD